jgi:hypothetical protein
MARFVYIRLEWVQKGPDMAAIQGMRNAAPTSKDGEVEAISMMMMRIWVCVGQGYHCSPKFYTMFSECIDGDVEVVANLDIDVAHGALGRLTLGPAIEGVLQALGREKQGPHGGGDVLWDALVSVHVASGEEAVAER